MAARQKRFIVLRLADRNNWGFDEQTLPPLVALMDSASPDYRKFWHSCVTGFFLTSHDALFRVQSVIDQAERLRTTDSRFTSLGIGLAEGSMIADFTFFGRLKPGMMPLGIIANDASGSERRLDAYQQLLQTLRHEFERKA